MTRVSGDQNAHVAVSRSTQLAARRISRASWGLRVVGYEAQRYTELSMKQQEYKGGKSKEKHSEQIITVL
jgi:hypothetical protein